MRLTWFQSCLLVGLLATTVASAAPPTTETMRIAVHLGALRDASRADVEIAMKVWAEEVMKVVEVPAEIRFHQNMTGIHNDLETGRANFVIADGINLLRYFNSDELADGFGSRGRGEDNMLLLARKNAGIRTVKDLAGKRVVIMSDNEISELWLETTCLRAFRQDCARSLLNISKEARSHQLVLKLFFDKADAALVRGQAYELAMEMNPQIRDRLQIVERIPIYPGALGLFSSRVSQKFRDYVIGKVPQLQNHPRGRQIMEVLQSEQIDRFPKSVLDPIRALLREYEFLSTRYAARGVDG